MMKRRRRSSSRRRKMAKLILLNGIPMQAPMMMMMMMTSHPRVAGIAIKEAPSLFSTPHCLMAKGGAKVQQDGELDEFSYDDLVEMLNDADEFMTKEKAKLKDLKLKFTSLQDSYEELKTSHENLKETHEKLEEAHNTLLSHERKATLSIGVSCDLIDDKSCGSSSTSSLCTKIDNPSCNESLI